MANVHNNLAELFTGIADAIRSKTGSTDPIVADEFPTAIEAIAAGGSTEPEEWIGDGNTHIWISLAEGRTSPMLGVGVNGTVAVDWGDGSAPDTLTGTDVGTMIYTPHEYGKAGDYVITLMVDGMAQIKGVSTESMVLTYNGVSGDKRNHAYRSAIQKFECGDNIFLRDNAFMRCYCLLAVNAPTATALGSHAFYDCFALRDASIPNIKTTNLSAFNNCYALTEFTVRAGVSYGSGTCSNCYFLRRVNIQDGVSTIYAKTFYSCYSIQNFTIPSSVTLIQKSAFDNCHSVAFYDFSKHTSIPTLAATDAFSGIPADCEIRVPAALVDEWKAATNWATYADYIVGV